MITIIDGIESAEVPINFAVNDMQIAYNMQFIIGYFYILFL